MHTIKTIADSACQACEKRLFLLILALGLGACTALPQPPARADVYDFGPGPMAAAPPGQGARQLPIVLLDVAASGLPEGSSALRYRLAYANAQQPHPYSQARWSQPPAQLLTQALRERLGERRTVLGQASLGQSLADGALPDVLRVELEEFSQVFSAPQASAALVRLRATLSRPTAGGEQVRAQQLFVVQRPAATQDAAGGARALADAAAQAAGQVQEWLAQVQR